MKSNRCILFPLCKIKERRKGNPPLSPPGRGFMGMYVLTPVLKHGVINITPFHGLGQKTQVNGARGLVPSAREQRILSLPALGGFRGVHYN